VRFACNGGCPKDRFIETPDGEPGLHYLCAGYKGFFRHVSEPMAQMSQLLRAGRAPAELMDGYFRQDAQRPRNSACPCGNGRKWKKCHGSPVVTTDPSAG
ncbi:MAG: anaerobic sulfatase maturase, partial [Actinobacteria bacterium]|nr:anaerobic sulfatase maturase [Actinomycetota bacterium]